MEAAADGISWDQRLKHNIDKMQRLPGVFGGLMRENVSSGVILQLRVEI